MLCTNGVTQGVTTGMGQAMPSNARLLNDPTPDELSQGRYHRLVAHTLPKVEPCWPPHPVRSLSLSVVVQPSLGAQHKRQARILRKWHTGDAPYVTSPCAPELMLSNEPAWKVRRKPIRWLS